jgi:GMP synthase (glutamine-hydrolysing)
MESITPQVTVLDAGGQYCHLIARKVRELGVYAEVRPSETPAGELASRRAIIISGGPASVYEASSPKVDPAIFAAGPAVLGICYGLQLMALNLGGKVARGVRGEYGMAVLDVLKPGALLVEGAQQVWMSHRDTVTAIPAGFELLARTDTCAFAAVAEPEARLYGVQFHPEVVHTTHGTQVLSNFLFGVAGCRRDWDPKHRVPLVEEQIRQDVGARNVFFFVSGGVDSTVAYTLCLRALGPERVRGVYVDTGLMREGETDFVRRVFGQLGARDFAVESAEAAFLGALTGVGDPEQKRHIIGQQFVEVQDRILNGLSGDWILGQGTIYPDTIESGGTAKADLIKTHHNRVAGIQKLIAEGRIVEPLTSFYKDEVREIGTELGLPGELLHRHPFPGPGLAIRCLCAETEEPVRETADGWVIPVRSVGVQGDSRTYQAVIAIEGRPVAGAGEIHTRATELINRLTGINRVVARVEGHTPLAGLKVTPGTLSSERLERLRAADAIVRRLSLESGFEDQVWQFPVVLVPVGAGSRRDSVVLRPIHSVDGMTARSVPMEEMLLGRMCAELLALEGVSTVFYDLTNKPPATIEWE